mmetsp:Transcript_84350/g.243447  ORF Transcript_84350/g.243447 Transcript_84350/m.243447 type:complete len:210 (-) Transcript_84350:514-1143(-)
MPLPSCASDMAGPSSNTRKRCGRKTASASAFTVQSCLAYSLSLRTCSHTLMKACVFSQELKSPPLQHLRSVPVTGLACTMPAYVFAWSLYTVVASHAKIPRCSCACAPTSPGSSDHDVTTAKQKSDGVPPLPSAPALGAVVVAPPPAAAGEAFRSCWQSGSPRLDPLSAQKASTDCPARQARQDAVSWLQQPSPWCFVADSMPTSSWLR